MARGYDHNFALDGADRHAAAGGPAGGPRRGRVLGGAVDRTGRALYTGNFLDGTYVGKKGHLYRMGDGIALEPQKFPDLPNKPDLSASRRSRQALPAYHDLPLLHRSLTESLT
jgi:aldose 1-epimerase